MLGGAAVSGDGWAADQSIKSVCDLKGKTIAVEPNLPARLIMQMALKKECNLSIKDTTLTDIAAVETETVRRLEAFVRRWRAGLHPIPPGAETLDDETIDGLRALGYL